MRLSGREGAREPWEEGRPGPAAAKGLGQVGLTNGSVFFLFSFSFFSSFPFFFFFFLFFGRTHRSEQVPRSPQSLSTTTLSCERRPRQSQ